MWQAAQTIFLSIVLESLPFVLLGVLLSSLIQELVSQERMLRLMPKNGKMAVLVSSLFGLVLPVCDCGTIPVARSLIRKGMPTSVAVSFTLSAPVVNPITMIATYVAFGMNASMMWLRVTTTFVISVVIGWILLSIETKENKHLETRCYEHALAETATTRSVQHRRSVSQVFGAVIGHAIIEFFEVGGFVVASAAVAAVLQTWIPASVLSPVGKDPIWSVAGMMILAILLSLCSEADAFVARSLSGLTTTGGVLGFLVIGQMIDMRNMFLLPSVFSRRIVIIAFSLAMILTLCGGILINYIGFKI
ncbi:permease [Polycladomyces sp. WAk]|uniref:Permease n=1 Tax=Polycladomyces zharkentensis TaxID=2807616 RepID=A0ABS2WKW8_9BACL|nr:permease [Polycladomyces sp. WAk]MBN2910101.1 permease [Polycladomyces sp. WAk]